MATVTMAVAEVRESEVGLVKQAVKTGKALVESATASVGAVCGVEVNMVDFRCECEDGSVCSCCGCFETFMLVRWRNRYNVNSNDIALETRGIVLVQMMLCWFQ